MGGKEVVVEIALAGRHSQDQDRIRNAHVHA